MIWIKVGIGRGGVSGVKKQRILIVVPSVLFLFLMVVAISGSGSHHDSKDVTSPAVVRELNETPQVVTIGELYAHSVTWGALVKVWERFYSRMEVLLGLKILMVRIFILRGQICMRMRIIK